MTVFGAILLALAAGLTEIFPVSGTGHFYILERVLGLTLTQADRCFFQGMLYFGTALALLLNYRHSVAAMLREVPRLFGGHAPARHRQSPSFARRELLLLLVSTVPMLLALLLRGLRTSMERSDNNLLFVGLLLCLSGVLLYFAGRGAREKVKLQQMTMAPALLLGLVQVAAVLPGLSRMGILLSACLAMGFESAAAVEYAGLMGIPAFFGAGVLSCVSARSETVTIPAALSLAAFFLTAVSALLALRILTKQVKTGKPTGFAYWCWGAAIISLVLFLISA